MKKKMVIMALALLTSLAGHAQFEKGKVYVGASLSGLDLSYKGSEESKIGLQAKGGYLFEDDWMLTGQLSYDKQHGVPAILSCGVGARYYIEQNGLYLGAGVKYQHNGSGYDDFLPGVHIGYAFFVSQTVTIEPEVYYDQSFKNHKDYSTIGFRIGFGIYL